MTRLGTDAKGRDSGRKQYIDRVRKAAAAYGCQPVDDPGLIYTAAEKFAKGSKKSSQRKRKNRRNRGKK